MKIFFIIILLFISFFTYGNEKETEYINLNDFVLKASKNSKIKEILSDELELVYQKRLKSPIGDMILNVIGEYNLNYAEKPVSGFTGSVKLSKIFNLSGTQISASYDLSLNQNKEQTSSVNLYIEQDIIKNAFGRSKRLERELAGYETEIAYYQIVEIYEEYFATIINLFFEWYSEYQNLLYAEKSYQESKKLYQNILNKKKYNIANQVDVNLSEIQLINKEEQLMNYQTSYNSILLKINNILNYTEDKELVPDFSPLIEKSFDLEDKYKNFEKESRFFKIQELLLKNSRLSLKITVDDLLPNTKLYGGYSLKGLNYFQDQNLEHNIEIGIKMDIPIIDHSARSEYKIKKLNIEKTELISKNNIDEMKINLQILNNQINEETRNIKLIEKKYKLSESVVKYRQNEYNSGQISLSELISAYNNLDEYYLNKINHTVLLNNYYIEWLRLTDSLINNKKEIQLNKHD